MVANGIFVIGTLVFGAASVWCGLAPNVTQLIVARGVQGVGGALLTPGSLAIISAAFPESERGKAIGLWSGFLAITTAAGPVLGGFVTDALSWRWVFLMVVPLALVVVLLTLWRVPESRDGRSRRWPRLWRRAFSDAGVRRVDVRGCCVPRAPRGAIRWSWGRLQWAFSHSARFSGPRRASKAR